MHRRRRLPHKMSIHINLRTCRIRQNRHAPHANRTRLLPVVARSSRCHRLRMRRPCPLIPSPARASDFRSPHQLHVKMIRLQHKIISVSLSIHRKPLKRCIRNRNLLRGVPVLIHAQSHRRFQPRPKNRMCLMEVTARIVRMKSSGPQQRPINLPVRPNRRASNVKRFRAPQRRQHKCSHYPRQSRGEESPQFPQGDPQGEESTMSPSDTQVNPHSYGRPKQRYPHINRTRTATEVP
jgi:hypothetical protein